MKAVVFQQYGSPDYLELKEIEKPAPRDNEVLVKIRATSINSWDWDLLLGTPFVNRLMFGLLKPKVILGCDIAGVVEEVGRNVKQFRPGDEVFGDLSACGFGGFAEYDCAREKALTLKPNFLTFEQAAAIPQAGLLALQGLHDKGRIKHGQKVLINGASGGVGTIAVQMAKTFGAEVTGVCSTEKMDMVRSLGADHVIDYKHEDFTKNGQRYDLILDVKGFHSIFDYKRALSSRGVYVMVGGATRLVNQLMFLEPFLTLFSRKRMGLLLHKANKEMDLLIKLIESGNVHIVIDRTYPLREAAEAMRYFGEARHKGKVVITLE